MPKVLIIRGRAGTWYENRVSSLHEFSHFADCVYIVKVGRGVFGWEVREEDGILLYTEAEYNEVAQQRDKMIDDLAKHAQTIVDLQSEKLRLEDGQGYEVAPIKLPAEVADALEYLGLTHSHRDIMAMILQGSLSKPFKGYDRRRDEAIRTLQVREFDDILIALADGYEVEQSPQEWFRAEVKEAICDWLPDGDYDMPDITSLVERIVSSAEELT